MNRSFKKGQERDSVSKVTTPILAGFTLVEIMVVIGIIGILATIVLAALNAGRSKSRDANRAANLKEMAKAINFYDSDVNNALAGCTGGVSSASASTNNIANCTGTVANPAAFNFSKVVDPSAPVAAGATAAGMCLKTASAACQYSIHANDGSAIAPTTQNWEICSFLENGDKPYGGSTAANAVVHVGSDTGTGVRFGCN